MRCLDPVGAFLLSPSFKLDCKVCYCGAPMCSFWEDHPKTTVDAGSVARTAVHVLVLRIKLGICDDEAYGQTWTFRAVGIRTATDENTG
eukprot:3880255-Amphidinium_carterae.1